MITPSFTIASWIMSIGVQGLPAQTASAPSLRPVASLLVYLVVLMVVVIFVAAAALAAVRRKRQMLNHRSAKPTDTADVWAMHKIPPLEPKSNSQNHDDDTV